MVALLCGCAPHRGGPDPGWVEHERGTSHVSHDVPVEAGGPRTIDLAHPEVLDEADAAAALAQLGERAPAAAVALRAARLAHHRGGDPEARAFVAIGAAAADEGTVHAELVALAKELAVGAPIAADTIAVLLPLSGRYAPIGAELRAAIELAPSGGAHLAFLDTRGDPDGAAAAVATADARGAIAILGPVGERESLAAARAAMLRGIPIALLAPADGADPHAGVFRVADSPADEARAIARYAAAEHFPTVAVLAPRDDVAAEQAAAFVAEAAHLGLQVTGNGTYDPTGGDVEPDVRAFLNLVPGTNPELREHLARHPKNGLTTFTPDVPFSLLYIPDRYDRAAIVTAFLPYYNVELRTSDALANDAHMLQKKHAGKIPQIVQLVGGAAWHHPSLALRGGTAVQGAFVADAFAPEVDDGASAFATDFEARTKRKPSTAAAEAFDAAALVAAARAHVATSPDPRAAMRAALASARLDAGACGPAAMSPAGEIEREFTMLEVSGDNLVAAP